MQDRKYYNNNNNIKRQANDSEMWWDEPDISYETSSSGIINFLHC